MKRILSCISIAALLLSLLVFALSCGKEAPVESDVSPEEVQMRSICELATMECYYHNVAKYKDEDAKTVMLFFKKDVHFWIEYSAIVKLGVDASLVKVTVEGDNVEITMPPGRVLLAEVDPSIDKASYIVAKDSAKISADEEIAAFKASKEDLEKTVAANKTMMAQAQLRAQKMLKRYVESIGKSTGKQYTITWVYVDDNGKPIGEKVEEAISTEAVTQ